MKSNPTSPNNHLKPGAQGSPSPSSRLFLGLLVGWCVALAVSKAALRQEKAGQQTQAAGATRINHETNRDARSFQRQSTQNAGATPTEASEMEKRDAAFQATLAEAGSPAPDNPPSTASADAPRRIDRNTPGSKSAKEEAVEAAQPTEKALASSRNNPAKKSSQPAIFRRSMETLEILQ